MNETPVSQSFKKRSHVRTLDVVAQNLSRRYRAERRFRSYGLVALAIASLFLLVLFGSIVINGYTAFVQTRVQLELYFDPQVLDPDGSHDHANLMRADYEQLLRQSLHQAFPDVKSREERRKLHNLISKGAAYELRDQVVQHPEFMGKTRRMWVKASSDIDQWIKSQLGETSRRNMADGVTIASATGHLQIQSSTHAFKEVFTELRQQVERQTRSRDERIQSLHRQLLTAPADQQDSLRTALQQLQEEQRTAGARGHSPEGMAPLSENQPSYLLKIHGGWVKLTAIDPDTAQGVVLIPLRAPPQTAQGSWELVKVKTPESGRRVKDLEIAWILSLHDQGKLATTFNRDFFTQGDSREPETAGIGGALVGSFLTLTLTLTLSFPIGVAAAIYLEEFAPRNRWTDLIEVNINNLAAVPSIVYGLLGLAVFINFFGLPRSAPLVGALVLTLMALPIIIIASRAALKSVPPSIREAALGIGASPTQTVFHHVLPLAMPGMLTGTILSMAHSLGETAPLLMIGMVAFIVDIPGGITDPAAVLPVQIYLWADSPERGFVELTSAAIMVLLIFLVTMNALAVILRRRFEKRW